MPFHLHFFRSRRIAPCVAAGSIQKTPMEHNHHENDSIMLFKSLSQDVRANGPRQNAVVVDEMDEVRSDECRNDKICLFLKKDNEIYHKDIFIVLIGR